MKFLKYFEDNYNMDTYPGPPIVNQATSTLAAGGSDGMIGGGAGFGMTGALGGEFPKKSGPTSTPYPMKYISKVKSINNKETKKRKNAIKKIQKINILNFEDFLKND